MYLFNYSKAAIEKCCILLRYAGDVLATWSLSLQVNATSECTLNPAGIYISPKIRLTWVWCDYGCTALKCAITPLSNLLCVCTSSQ